MAETEAATWLCLFLGLVAGTAGTVECNDVQWFWHARLHVVRRTRAAVDTCIQQSRLRTDFLVEGDGVTL